MTSTVPPTAIRPPNHRMPHLSSDSCPSSIRSSSENHQMGMIHFFLNQLSKGLPTTSSRLYVIYWSLSVLIRPLPTPFCWPPMVRHAFTAAHDISDRPAESRIALLYTDWMSFLFYFFVLLLVRLARRPSTAVVVG